MRVAYVAQGDAGRKPVRRLPNMGLIPILGSTRVYCMRIVKRSTLIDFAARHAPAAAAINLWLEKASKAHWQKPGDALAAFPSSKVLDGERVRFEIGNNYRMIVAFFWSEPTAYIKFIGSHAEYDKVNAMEVSMF